MLKPFDLVMTWGSGFISGAISFFTRKGPSHVRVWVRGLGIKDENGREFDFWEVTFPKTKFGFVEEIPKLTKLRVIRHKDMYDPLPEELRNKGIDEMIKIIKFFPEYDVGELLWVQFWDELGISNEHMMGDLDRYVCSSGAERILTVMTFPLCPGEIVVSPNDQWTSDLKIDVGGREVIV